MIRDDTAAATLAAAMWAQVRTDLGYGVRCRVRDGVLVSTHENGTAAIEALNWLTSDAFTRWCAVSFGTMSPDEVRAQLLKAWKGPAPMNDHGIAMYGGNDGHTSELA